MDISILLFLGMLSLIGGILYLLIRINRENGKLHEKQSVLEEELYTAKQIIKEARPASFDRARDIARRMREQDKQ